MLVAEKLAKLRELMRAHHIDYYYVPATDQHDNEYLPDCWQRRRWISDFTGSAGDALIGLDSAYLWTDGRYTLQAKQQLDPQYFTLMPQQQGTIAPIHEWLQQNGAQKKIGADPKVMKTSLATLWTATLSKVAGELVMLDENLVDTIWENRPTLPHQPVILWDDKYAGASSKEKIQRLRHTLQQQNATAQVITMLDAIAWLLNIRGNDIQFNPLVIAYLIVAQETVTLLIDSHVVSSTQQKILTQAGITLAPYQSFKQHLNNLQGNILIDPNQVNYWVKKELIHAEKIIEAPSPINLMKAIKNPVEILGMQEAHRLDAIALCRFFCWLETHWHQQTEISVADKLEALRREHPDCRGLSFATISSMAEHGAIIHYFPTDATNKTITDDNLYLMDSGGQYWQGTTDVTRTIHLGMPTAEQKKHYTLVLKSHLALRHTIFPQGTCGEQLNAIAHWPLWQNGLDFSHGAGHGVGCFLCVHEGPQRISNATTGIPLLPGMIVSNEPGLYLENRYGIRIENLVLIQPALTAAESLSGHGPFYRFTDLTLVPYARSLIDTALLSQTEIAQVNEYHQQIYQMLHENLSPTESSWLQQATQPL